MNLHTTGLLLLSTILILFLQYSHQQIPLSRQYQYNTTLAKDGSFDLFWSIQDSDLYVAMSAKTNGWLAVGFNSFVENEAEIKDVDMRLTDMIIGWRDSSGNTYLYDSYAMSNSIPSMDTQLGGTDNSILIQSWEITGRTLIEFKRPLDTKDSYDLTMLPNKKLILLYALSAQDPNNNQYTSLSIHTKRGTVAIPNFWPQLQNETHTEKQSNITQLSNQTSSNTSSNSSSSNNSSNSSSTNQTSINFPVVTFPPQNNNNNNNNTSSTTTNPPPPSPSAHHNNQTVIVIPPFFPSSSNQIIGNNGNNNNNNGSSSSGKPGKEKPQVQTGTSGTSLRTKNVSYPIFIVVANLLIMQMLLSFLL